MRAIIIFLLGCLSASAQYTYIGASNSAINACWFLSCQNPGNVGLNFTTTNALQTGAYSSDGQLIYIPSSTNNNEYFTNASWFAANGLPSPPPPLSIYLTNNGYIPIAGDLRSSTVIASAATSPGNGSTPFWRFPIGLTNFSMLTCWMDWNITTNAGGVWDHIPAYLNPGGTILSPIQHNNQTGNAQIESILSGVTTHSPGIFLPYTNTWYIGSNYIDMINLQCYLSVYDTNYNQLGTQVSVAINAGNFAVQRLGYGRFSEATDLHPQIIYYAWSVAWKGTSGPSYVYYDKEKYHYLAYYE